MPVLTSRLVATLVDQISGPAKAAGAAIGGMGRAIKAVNAIRGTAQGPQAAATAMRQFSRDTQQAFAKAEASAHRFAHEMQHGIGVAALASGAVIGEALKSGIEVGADFAHQQALFRSVGMTGSEVANATAEAWRVTGEVAGSTIADNLKAVRELRGVFGDTAEATEKLQGVQRAVQLMKVINPAINGEEQAFDLAKALEIKGVSQDPEHFARLLNEMVKASNAMGGKVSGTDFLDFMKYSKAAGRGLSDQFLTQYAPSLMQELGGSSAGTALETLRQTVVGGVMGNREKNAWDKLGLLDQSKVIRTKTGSVKGYDGSLAGSAVFQADPNQWVKQYLKPALDKAGIISPDAIAEILSHLFHNRNAEQMVSLLLTQQQRLEKDAAMQRGAEGSEGYDKIRFSSATTGFEAFRTSFSTLLASLTSPLMKPAAMAMYYMTNGVNALAGALGRVPGLGAALGGVGGLIAATTAMRTMGRLGSLVGMTGSKGGLVKTLGLDLVGRGVLALASPFTALSRHAIGTFQTMGLRFRMMNAEMRAGTIGLGGVARGTFATIARAVVGLVNPFRMAETAMKAFKFALASTGIGLLLVGIAAGAEFIRTNWEGVRVAVASFAAEFQLALGPLAEGSMLKNIVDFVTGIWDALSKPISLDKWAAWGVAAGKWAATAAKWIQDNIGAAFDYIEMRINKILHQPIILPFYGRWSLADGALPPENAWKAPATVPGAAAGVNPQFEQANPLSPEQNVNRMLGMAKEIADLQRLKALMPDHYLPPQTQAHLDALRQTLNEATSQAPEHVRKDIEAYIAALAEGGGQAATVASQIASRIRTQLDTVTPSPAVPTSAPAAAAPSAPAAAPAPAQNRTHSNYHPTAIHAGDVHATFHIYGAHEPDAAARTMRGKLDGLMQATARGLQGDYGVAVGA